MQAQQAILSFNDAESLLGQRLLEIAIEIDHVEGYSEPHAIAIAWTAEKIGARMGLHGVDLTALKFAALAHDLGERSLKRNYLLRPISLSWEETLDLWRHPILGEQAAGELKLPRHSQLLIRWHHEWWNGGGYPDGLEGETIPLGARILRAVDSYFALISDRPHRRRFDRGEAEQIITDLAGIELDPQVAKLLLQFLDEENSKEQTFAYQSTGEARTTEVSPYVAQPALEPVGFSNLSQSEPQLNIENQTELTNPDFESSEIIKEVSLSDITTPISATPDLDQAEDELFDSLSAHDVIEVENRPDVAPINNSAPHHSPAEDRSEGRTETDGVEAQVTQKSQEKIDT